MNVAGERRRLFGALAVAVSSLLVVVPQYYLAVAQPPFDWMVALFAVVLPTVVGSALFWAVKSRTLLFLFLAYIPSVTDDSPVNLDSIYTWPEVTSGLHHTITEVILHALTLVFLCLAVREASKGGGKMAPRKLFAIALITLAAFAAASVSVIPLPSLQAAIATSWYQIDLVGHVVSLGLVCLAMREPLKRFPSRSAPRNRWGN